MCLYTHIYAYISANNANISTYVYRLVLVAGTKINDPTLQEHKQTVIAVSTTITTTTQAKTTDS